MRIEGRSDLRGRFLYEWILSHIAHDDKLFVRSVLEYRNLTSLNAIPIE